jgi:integrase/recombinase XerD
MTESYEISCSGRRGVEGPLLPYIAVFAERLRSQGYSKRSVGEASGLVADFSEWLKQKKIAKEDISLKRTELYLRYRALHRRPRKSDVATMRRLLNLLREEGVIKQAPACPEPTPMQRLLDEYAFYLRQERALAPATLVNYLPIVRGFLMQRFGKDRPQLSVIRAADVVQYVQHQVARLSPHSAKYVTKALRSFLQYARYRGDITLDLAAAVPTVANWSMASIPRAIAPDHVQAVLAHCNRASAIGCRDYAILLLLARLGLRAGEIAFLELDDIDWEAAILNVRSKGGRISRLPLPLEVGEAIAAYLRTGRPVSTSRRVFLRALAPIRGFARQVTVLSVVRQAMVRAGIDPPRKGAHQFRHALACEMLRQGASLPEIGQILGHRSPQTTAIYAKVDLASLHTLALPWPGGV